MAAITIYSKPGCPQCVATGRKATKLGLEVREVDLTQQPAALAYVTDELGYSAAPVVVVEDGTEQNHWSGYRPDLLTRAAGA